MTELGRIIEVDHRTLDVCARLHDLQMAAYAQEATLLGVEEFPPIALTPAQLAKQDVRYFCTQDGEHLLAALALERMSQKQYLIASLVVAPAQQRRGLARHLLQSILQLFPMHRFQVNTARLNVPACQLYLKCGFNEVAQRRINLANGEQLDLVTFLLA